MFDVDDFKQINDQSRPYDREIFVLQDIAECIKKSYANFGYCYRIGGDEFCVSSEKRWRTKEGVNKNFCRDCTEKRGEIRIFTYGILWISPVFRMRILLSC